MSVSIVLLAAGSSSRMGQSKQLMRIGNEAMLRDAIKKAQASLADGCIVVLGSNEHAHFDAIIDLNAQVVVNPHWERGMGSSLKAGLSFAVKNDMPDAILVMLTDQPAITSSHLDSLITTYQKSQVPIVAAEYEGAPGVPALIDSALFHEIMSLHDGSGAKQILIKYREQSRLIPIPEAAIDIDTPEDYARYNTSSQ